MIMDEVATKVRLIFLVLVLFQYKKSNDVIANLLLQLTFEIVFNCILEHILFDLITFQLIELMQTRNVTHHICSMLCKFNYFCWSCHNCFNMINHLLCNNIACNNRTIQFEKKKLVL